MKLESPNSFDHQRNRFVRDGFFHPKLVVDLVADILDGVSAKAVCDPWAIIGDLLASAIRATHAHTAIAFMQGREICEVGRSNLPAAQWIEGNPLAALREMDLKLDVVVTVPPFNARPVSSDLSEIDSRLPMLTSDLGSMILVHSALRLNDNGLGLYVVPPSFFFAKGAIRHEFDSLGLGLEAAFALPYGTFAPHTTIETYLIAVRRRPCHRIFVAEVASDTESPRLPVANFKAHSDAESLALGRYTDASAFIDFNSLRIEERILPAARSFGAPLVPLETLATSITLGRSGDFAFHDCENCIFVPMIGRGDVVLSTDDLTMKPQNYAQVGVAPSKSLARFVAQFLNSDVGKELRELSMGGYIPRLNSQRLRSLPVVVPNLGAQKKILSIESRIAGEQNTLLGLQSELDQLQRELWTGVGSISTVDVRLREFSDRMSTSLRQEAESSLDRWLETLPFPLASILRAWRATLEHDYKTRTEHLLHFFEAYAEFLSLALLSAFSSNTRFFAEHQLGLTDALGSNHSLHRPTFGTWKVVCEYLGKRTRRLLDSDSDNRQLCAELFRDRSFVLPETLSRKELGPIMSATIKLRNDWHGHGGVVGQEVASLLHGELLAQLQLLRQAQAGAWSDIRLVKAVQSRFRSDTYENDVAILSGSNSEFLTETVEMAVPLNIERVYLAKKREERALVLLPLLRIGPSPRTSMNACYFFNRLEGEKARFVSYHFVNEPELIDYFADATQAISLLTTPQS